MYSISRSKSIERMTNTDDIKKMIEKIYKVDVEAIRNLSHIANKLQGKGKHKNKEIVLPGNLTIRGNLKINNNLTVDKNSNVRGQTTINQLYGGIKGWNNWRSIKVNGNNLSFDIGNNKFGFNNDANGIHFANSNKYKKLPIYYGADIKGKINTKDIYVEDLVDAKRMDVRNDGGYKTTHFNYNKSGNNILRGDLKENLHINGQLVVKNQDKITLRSNRDGRRLQNGGKNARFDNKNRGSWEKMYIETF
tara:strand:- start:25 stop:771 length:747 start_codon:yes stop_codon:yes gene_type:complete